MAAMRISPTLPLGEGNTMHVQLTWWLFHYCHRKGCIFSSKQLWQNDILFAPTPYTPPPPFEVVLRDIAPLMLMHLLKLEIMLKGLIRAKIYVFQRHIYGMSYAIWMTQITHFRKNWCQDLRYNANNYFELNYKTKR